MDGTIAYVPSAKETSVSVDTVLSMICPAHAHGTIKEAAQKFVDSHSSIYATNPNLLTAMWICRSGLPKHYYTFGGLPDIAIINTNLPNNGYTVRETFHPFYTLATHAYEASSPNRYYACVPCGHDVPLFADCYPTPDEIRFMAYSAIAAGAKGVLYRGGTASLNSKLRKASFAKLNLELQLLKPYLTVSDPVGWAKSEHENIAAKTLLCGDKNIVLILFDKQCLVLQGESKIKSAVSRKQNQEATIFVDIPTGFLVEKIDSISRPQGKINWQQTDRQLKILTDLELSSEALLISLVPE